MLTVSLTSCGNPDYFQDQPVSPSQSVKVNSLEEASKVCRQYIVEWLLGGGNWSGGQVYNGDKQIARISYNGRIWDMSDQEIKD